MSNRLRLAVITPHFPTRTEPHRGAPVWNSITALARMADVDVYCTYPRYVGPRPAWLHEGSVGASDEFRAQLLEYRALPAVSRVLNGQSILRALRRQVRYRPDVILAYWIYPDGYAAVRLAQEIGTRAVLFSRGSDLKINAAFPLTKSAYRYAISNAAAVIGVSRDLADCASRLGARPERNYAIPNGIDTSLFSLRDQAEARRALSIPNGRRIALYVGRLEPKKGLPQLVDALAVARRMDPSLALVLVGNGMMEPGLRRRAAELGVDSAVIFTGPMQHRDLAPWINAADVLCLPSESEGCPNVVLEALSCGRPVVATAVGGVPDIVDESCGILIPSNDPGVLAEAILRGVATRWDRGQIAARWKRSWTQVAEETLRVCEAAAA
jgi:glycosyltransferase involved in cell wall biosynthesis